MGSSKHTGKVEEHEGKYILVVTGQGGMSSGSIDGDSWQSWVTVDRETAEKLMEGLRNVLYPDILSCPKCGSGNIRHSEHDAESEVWYLTVCDACGHTWNEVFKFCGAEPAA